MDDDAKIERATFLKTADANEFSDVQAFCRNEGLLGPLSVLEERANMRPEPDTEVRVYEHTPTGNAVIRVIKNVDWKDGSEYDHHYHETVADAVEDCANLF